MKKEKGISSNWVIDPELYNSLNYTVLKEILQKGEDRFMDQNNEFREIRTKSFTILAILITFLSLLVPIILDKFKEQIIGEIKSCVILVLIILVIFAFILIIFKLTNILYPKKRMLPGEEPKTVNYSNMASIQLKHQEFTFVINCIENIQWKIDYNEEHLQSEIKILKYVIRCFSFSLLALLVISLILMQFQT